MTIEIIEEVIPGTSVIEEIVNLQLSVIEGDTAAAEAAAAAAAASAASASSSASTATTQAGIATTKAQEADASATAAETARTGAETAETNAETAQAAAEAARDEITDKVVFTGIQVGDLLQAVDVSGDVKLVRVTPVDLLKSTGPFLKSPLVGIVDFDNVFAWDSFNRANGVIGISDSGDGYINLNGTTSTQTIFNNKVETNSLPYIINKNLSVDNIYTSNLYTSFFVQAELVKPSAATGISMGWYVDNNNYFFVEFLQNIVTLTKVVSGVSSLVQSTLHRFSINNRLRGARSLFECNIQLTSSGNSQLRIVTNFNLVKSVIDFNLDVEHAYYLENISTIKPYFSGIQNSYLIIN